MMWTPIISPSKGIQSKGQLSFATIKGVVQVDVLDTELPSVIVVHLRD